MAGVPDGSTDGGYTVSVQYDPDSVRGGSHPNSEALLNRQPQQRNQEDHISLVGHDSQPLRFLCFMGGLVVVLTAFFAGLQFWRVFSHPALYFLNFSQGAFGIITGIIESKSIIQADHLKPQIAEYFKILTLLSGKAFFYFYIGIMSLSLYGLSILHIIAGLYMLTISVLMYIMKMKQNQKNQDSDGCSPPSA